MATISSLSKPASPWMLRRGHPLAQGLVASYVPSLISGGTTLRDYSGREKHGTFVGSSMGWTSGLDGGAVLLPGVANNYIDIIPAAALVPLAEFTAMIRWRVQSLVSFQFLLQMRVTGSGNDQIDIATNTANTTDFRVLVANGGTNLSVTNADDATGSISVAIGAVNWICVTNSKKGNALSVYGRNGLIATKTGVGVASASAMNSGLFGTSVFGGGTQCDLSALHLWNRPLSADDCMWLYQEPL